jgi:uncharacterized membrane protein
MCKESGQKMILFLSELLEGDCHIMYILRTIWWDLLRFVFGTFTLSFLGIATAFLVVA